MPRRLCERQNSILLAVFISIRPDGRAIIQLAKHERVNYCVAICPKADVQDDTVLIVWSLNESLRFISAYVFHSTGLLVSHFLRSIGVPCSLYIDDRHNGELQFKNSGLQRVFQQLISDELGFAAATEAAIFFFLFLPYCALTQQ